ncbi:hypothetical protein I4F81_012446 [Pyropia yezoensis]|uniref:Uncharacterized protein n=1 Tax=Pyropia yezoensis TaxID=2788 RepID=A0ACC3CJ56_PYRYE|nr:hypothetical protein I4F81_012446 [Neopyropia yezoensis]
MAPLATPPRPPPRVGVQDMAPPGGYASIGVARNVPKSVGPRASLLMLAGALVMGGGLYRVGTFNVHRRELKEERAAIRRALTPLLQAEEDARFVRAQSAYVEWEAQLMAGKPDWNADTNVYKTRSYMPPMLSSHPGSARQ